ncbi:FecR domain-containing protein [Desulfurispirillum indicum]|uniref:FecR family protein n=1 Tax=Desulfurispirillum indicum TaxID=936456 RepID=UPI001CFC03BF|nr:FecR domain-containing protein [Desulfurispirillum indicum]UCZ56813.1 FecR domain-containing protein [Desulfurispirillum indicum]
MKVLRHIPSLLALLFLSATSLWATPEPIGTVVGIQGQVWAHTENSQRALRLKSSVYPREEIVTGSEGRVQISFLDDSVLSQGPQSSVILDTYIFDPTAQDSNLMLRMQRGAFRNITGRIAEQNPENHKLESPLAVIGIRGTDIVGQITPDGSSQEIGAMSGTITYHNDHGDFDVPPGFSVSSTPDASIFGPMSDLLQQSAADLSHFDDQQFDDTAEGPEPSSEDDELAAEDDATLAADEGSSADDEAAVEGDSEFALAESDDESTLQGGSQEDTDFLLYEEDDIPGQPAIAGFSSSSGGQAGSVGSHLQDIARTQTETDLEDATTPSETGFQASLISRHTGASGATLGHQQQTGTSDLTWQAAGHSRYNNASFMEWGYWESSSQQLDQRRYDVRGNLTAATDITRMRDDNIVATYSGSAFGIYSPLGEITYQQLPTGSFSGQIHFGSGEVRNFQVNFSDIDGGAITMTGGRGTLSAHGTYTLSIDQFESVTLPGASVTEGSLRGGTYGSFGAGTGGVWELRSGTSPTDAHATGNFEGQRQ